MVFEIGMDETLGFVIPDKLIAGGPGVWLGLVLEGVPLVLPEAGGDADRPLEPIPPDGVPGLISP